MTKPTIEQLMQRFQLKPLRVEGGHFRQTYRSGHVLRKDTFTPPYQEDKPAGTAIVYLYTPEADSFSAMHRLPTDETYHFYLGDPVLLLLLHADGTARQVVLGPGILDGQFVQFTVPAGVWQGSYMVPGGDYALIGMTMAPGFTNSDYEGGDRDTLIATYPDEATLIKRLTRPDQPLKMPDDD